MTTKITNDNITSMDAGKLTGALPAVDGSALTNMPSGVTKNASDPAIDTNPSGGVGTIWANTTSGEMYVLTDATAGANVWTNVGDGAGTIKNGYEVDFLLVAGGGAGTQSGGFMSGGGGGGGLRTSYGLDSGGGSSAEAKTLLTKGATYTITVGAGGSTNLESGGDSSIVGTAVNLVAAGGGAGAVNPPSAAATSGGSGGGGFRDVGWQTPGDGTVNQGYGGGQGGPAGGYPAPCGGGGGAGEKGHSVQPGQYGGNIAGGAGLQVGITGTGHYWAGGGGGGCHSPHTPGPGGIGGGGYGKGYQTSATGSAGGSAITSDAGMNGGTNTGGGAGGDTWYYTPGTNGGSGCVVLRVPTNEYAGNSSVTGSPTIGTDGSDTILTFTGTGTYTA